ncbi:MAG: hypothetical protein ACF8R7_12125 [Phycisphaerales bacterium JB039]
MQPFEISEADWKRVARAAEAAGETPRTFIRRAITERCERMAGATLGDRLADIVGSVNSGGAIDSRRTGRAFADVLVREEAKRQRRGGAKPQKGSPPPTE